VPDAGTRSEVATEYRRWSQYRPSDPAKTRPPASIFHKDERNLEDVISETKRYFRPHEMPEQTKEDFYSKYRATTYKRDADPRFKVAISVISITLRDRR